MRGDFETAAPFIGFAVVLDMLDGRIARHDRHDQRVRRRSSIRSPTSISFGMAPAVLAFRGAWCRSGASAGRSASCSSRPRRMRLARFNIQTTVADKRYFVGMPSPAAAGVPAATVFFLSGRSSQLPRRPAGAARWCWCRRC